MTRRYGVAAAALALVTVACSSAPSGAPLGTDVQHVVERVLEMDHPADVRWLDDDHVLVADPGAGVARIAIRDAALEWLPSWRVPARPQVGSRPVHLALSRAYVVAADVAFGLTWRGRDDETKSGTASVEFIADVDALDDRLLIAGLRRDAEGELGSDGSLAWVGEVSHDLTALRPLLPFRDRGAIENCAGFGLGAVRFLSDGSFVVVPGAEAGVYLYTPEGRLKRTWDTAALRIPTDCDGARGDMSALASDPAARQRYLNRRRIVDDVIALPGGPALVVRSVSDGVTRWELVSLGGAEPSVRPLPFTSHSLRAHVAADARGERVVFVISDRLRAREPGTRPRLVVLQVKT